MIVRVQTVILVVVVRMRVLDDHDLRECAAPADHAMNRRQQQHPSTPNDWRTSATSGAPDDVHAEPQQGRPDKSFHHDIDCVGEPLGEQDRSQPEEQHHRCVTQRVERGEEHRPARCLLRAGEIGAAAMWSQSMPCRKPNAIAATNALVAKNSNITRPFSADSGERVADEHVDDAGAAEWA